MKKPLILVRGGGDIATGAIYCLWSAGFDVIVLEAESPSAIRRQAAVCEAVYDGEKTVEDMKAVKAESVEAAFGILKNKNVPVLVDENASAVLKIKPDILVDGILAKKNMGTKINMAALTIALGPGFTAGKDVDYVIETQRGHNLGRIISEGKAAENTGIPGNIGGYTTERVIHSPAEGIIRIVKDIGSSVKKGDLIAFAGEAKVYASIDGIIRGMIKEGYNAHKGLKIADIDPRKEEYENCFTISDKARCIGGSVLQLVCGYMVKINEKTI